MKNFAEFGGLIFKKTEKGKKPGILEENRLFFCVCVEDVSI